MAKDTPKTPESKLATPDTAIATRWMIVTLVILSFIILAIGAAGTILSPDQPKNQPGISAQSTTPDTAQREQKATTAKKEDQKNKLLIFSLFGALLLIIALIPKLPAKGLIGGAGALLLLFGIIAWAITFVWPDVSSSGSTKDTKTSATQKSSVKRHSYQNQAYRLPPDAVFVKTIAPGEKVFLTRTRMDLAPPKFYAKFDDGTVQAFDVWPADAKHRFASNKTSRSYDFFVVVVPGQNYFTGSRILDQRPAGLQPDSNNGCLLDKTFGQKTAERTKLVYVFRNGRFE